ncbi:hypothetical protein LMZ02_23960 [Paenibacillus macerans]|uniref:hypothetical protein n=1 Tax=Paenibacillus macerans TaxID=44252 RepID=UPI001F0DA4CE|nr:hypothetical protein [Paenibacillus macerans]MED4957201.1 hypothetical protein [Paenibacillus macerans]UMV46505.1 hypothetical protein LMZ02_23960 [Paenibacillus macerans]
MKQIGQKGWGETPEQEKNVILLHLNPFAVTSVPLKSISIRLQPQGADLVEGAL